MTVSIHVTGGVRTDRFYQYAVDLHDTGCTMIRHYAPPGKRHSYSYTVTINLAGRHFGRDELYINIDPYHRGQTVYSGVHNGGFQLFTVQKRLSLVLTELPSPGAYAQVRLSPDLRSGTVTARGIQASWGSAFPTVSVTGSWSCPVLFHETW